MSLRPVDRPLVTCVCLTTHPRRAAYLPDALRSFRQQTWPRKELVVVNDGQPLASSAPDVIVANLPPRTPAWTMGEKRNVGVRLARGDLVASWDDDDVYLPERLAEQVWAMREWRVDVVLADGMYVADQDLHAIGRCYRGGGFAVQASILADRNKVVLAGGYSVCLYAEDAEMLERIRYLARGQVATMPDARWYIYRRHDSNASLLSEPADYWPSCAARDPDVEEVSAAIAAMRRGPGGEDVE